MLSSSSPSRVLAQVTVKLYHAKFSGMEYDWQYFNQRGTIQFCLNNCEADVELSTTEESASPKLIEADYWFRLRDELSGKILWTFSIPEECRYHIEKPFFHIFNGRSRMWGFLFDRDEDGYVFGQSVQAHLPTSATQDSQMKGIPPYFPPFLIRPSHHAFVVRKSPSKHSGRAPSVRSERTTISRFENFGFSNASAATLALQVSPEHKPRPPMMGISTSIISLPQTNSFLHIGHIGLGRDGVIECSEGINPAWSKVITELQTHASLVPEALKRKEFFNNLRSGIKRLGPATVRSGRS
ncbi:MAG: hypothetical protein NXY57DRAFT_963007 [Lentinula lateritia]|nr:MAG: hypothetical protein NXY57DRAFT_963007 [Lentinula lateritia]